MAIFTALPENLSEVDIIVAGGGTAGCIVASRISDADPALTILVIERGPNNLGDPTVAFPMLWAMHHLPGTKTAKAYTGKEEQQLGGRAVSIVQGATLGGTSSINMVMYSRGQTCDYDSWKSPGWSTKELLPHFKKIETYHGKADADGHGYDGPVQISDGSFRNLALERDFIRAMDQVGYPEVEDLHDFQSNNAVSHARRTVTPEGLRNDTATAYLHPRLQDGKHPNLHVLVQADVIRVLIDQDKNATGVEYRPDQTLFPDSPSLKVSARKLVIVSCGTLGTPSVLERSGVGDPDVLDAAKVPVLARVPGVGQSFQDHQLVYYSYKADLAPQDTFDGIFSGRVSVPDLIQKQDKILGWNGYDASAKIRPTEAEVDELGPEFRARWDRDFQQEPQKPLVGLILAAGLLAVVNPYPEGQHYSIAPYTCYPYSRGHIHITGPGIDDPTNFETRYLTDEHDIDLKTQLWAYKKQREISRQMRTHLGIVPEWAPQFPEGSSASYEHDLPDESGELRELKYTSEDNDAILSWLKSMLSTCWHVLGTCKMAPREELGVVDESLSVHGVQRLKLVDLSIAPENVASNTCNTAMVIGEKAADICIRELGLA